MSVTGCIILISYVSYRMYYSILIQTLFLSWYHQFGVRDIKNWYQHSIDVLLTPYHFLQWQIVWLLDKKSYLSDLLFQILRYATSFIQAFQELLFPQSRENTLSSCSPSRFFPSATKWLSCTTCHNSVIICLPFFWFLQIFSPC